MYSSVRREIPEFLSEQIVYCDNLVHNRRERSCLLLTRNLHFYEFQQKQLKRSIDLHNTCLSKVAANLELYKGPKGKWFDNCGDSNDQLNSSQDTSTLELPTQQPDICLGKYIYLNMEVRKLYVLLRCWDKLLVLHRPDEYVAEREDGFQIVAEFENVCNFKLVHGHIKYQAVVEIEFGTAEKKLTDFQLVEPPQENKSDTTSNNTNKNDLKQLLERVRSAQTELQLHQTITQRELERMRDVQTFGCAFVRGLKLEEQPMLTRCGDIWLRITPQDELVLGVPLVNNCQPPNLTVVQDLQPILQLDEAAGPVDGSMLKFEQRLYQLRQSFERLESIDTFLQSMDTELQANSWNSSGKQCLLPGSFAVLLLKMPLTSVLNRGKCPLFLCYNVEKDLELSENAKNAKKRKFEMQIYLKTIDFQQVLGHRQAFELTFKANTLHQDFLAVAFSAFELKLLLQFATSKDLETFERLIVQKFDFELMCGHEANNASCLEAMDVDSEQQNASTHNSAQFPHTVFYNRQPASMWYGLLVLKEAPALDADMDTPQLVWKFFAIDEQKALLLLKLLFQDLLLNKCNVLKISQMSQQKDVQLIEFENALRQELQAKMELLNSNSLSDRKQLEEYQHFLELQWKTDLLAVALK